MGRWKSLFAKKRCNPEYWRYVRYMSFYIHWYSHDIQASFCTEICHSFYPNISKICPIYFTDFPIWFCGDVADRWPAQAPQRIVTSRCIHPERATGHLCFCIHIIHDTDLISYFSVCDFIKYVSWPRLKRTPIQRKLWKPKGSPNSESSSLAPSQGCGCGSFNTSTGLNSLGLAIFTFGACRNLHKKWQKWCCSLRWVWQHLWIDWSLSRLTAAESTFWRSNPCRFQEFSCMEPWNGLFLVLERSFCCCLFVVVIIFSTFSYETHFWSGFPLLLLVRPIRLVITTRLRMDIVPILDHTISSW